MRCIFTGGTVFADGTLKKADFAVDGGQLAPVPPGGRADWLRDGWSVEDVSRLLAVPGFVDLHVHLRQPGYEYKETIATGTAAAAAGGYTAVCAMPNLNPVPDSREHLDAQLEIIRRDAVIHVLPYGAITVGERGEELSDMAAMAPDIAGFSDDGRGVQSMDVMRRAMLLAKSLHRPIAAHCEDESLLPRGWAAHDGAFARRRGLTGNPPESEWRQVERDLNLVRETGCPYHVCHVSTKESVELVRQAKREGLPVSCETGPHYLTLCDEDLQDDGRFKMNPPIRAVSDRDALLAGLLDGTVDCIATDHAPHSEKEKSGGLRRSLNGIVGLETAFPVLYTRLAEPGRVPLGTLLRALCVRPREILGLPGGNFRAGDPADITLLDLHCPYIIDSAAFRSLGHASPFDGWAVCAALAATICGGKCVYRRCA
ncbi:MAG: dihydroorotase [Oscillibacter sp.]|nr:dihydroorotase [Oscillibacter sp.]